MPSWTEAIVWSSRRTRSQNSCEVFLRTSNRMHFQSPILVVLVLIFSAINVIAPDPPLSSEGQQQHNNHHVPWIEGGLPHPQDRASRGQMLSHLQVAHPNIEREALQFARRPFNGPIFLSYGRGMRSAYVTTRLPGGEFPAWRWGYRNRDHDLYAFWHVSGEGVRLKRLDAWHGGAAHPQIMTWSQLTRSLRA